MGCRWCEGKPNLFKCHEIHGRLKNECQLRCWNDRSDWIGAFALYLWGGMPPAWHGGTKDVSEPRLRWIGNAQFQEVGERRMKDHDSANPHPLPRQPGLYFRVKRKSGKWSWIPAPRYGFQHQRCVQVEAYVYTEEDQWRNRNVENAINLWESHNWRSSRWTVTIDAGIVGIISTRPLIIWRISNEQGQGQISSRVKSGRGKTKTPFPQEPSADDYGKTEAGKQPQIFQLAELWRLWVREDQKEERRMTMRRRNNNLTSARRFNDIQKRLDVIELKLHGILLIMTRIFGEEKNG